MKLRYKIGGGILGFFAVVMLALAITLSYTSDCGPAPIVSDDAELMKAIEYRCYGSPEVLELADIEKAGFDWADVSTPGRWRHGPGRNETHQAFTTYIRTQRHTYDTQRKVIVIRPIGKWPYRLRHLAPIITRYLMLYFRRPVRWEG